MTTTWVRRTLIGCIALIALFVLIVPIAKFATMTPGVLEACVNPGNGNMRLVDSSTPCHNNESRISWNITGPAGPPGRTSLPEAAILRSRMHRRPRMARARRLLAVPRS